MTFGCVFYLMLLAGCGFYYIKYIAKDHAYVCMFKKRNDKEYTNSNPCQLIEKLFYKYCTFQI